MSEYAYMCAYIHMYTYAYMCVCVCVIAFVYNIYVGWLVGWVL